MSGTADSIWQPRYVWVTVGAVAMIFLAATQALAVTTVMPVVSAALDGASLYAVAFSGTLATSVIGMVAVGAWCDRSDPVWPLTSAVGLFVAGLVLAGIAADMGTLVAGRLVQGLGTGGQTVALYVVVARVFPAHLHGRVFAAFSAAWVVPSLVGPVLAGAVADYLHWRWVFLGVALLTLVSYAMVYARLRGLPLRTEVPSEEPVARRLAWAGVVAASVLALSLAGEAGDAAPVIVAVAVVLLVIAARPLLPPRTLSVGRGLASVVLMRALIAGALFGAEIYVPYLLISQYGFSSTWAGLGLTSAALMWAAGAEVQGRFGDRLGNIRIALLGTSQLALAALIAAATAVWMLSPVVIIVGWALAGAGMGLMYPRLTVLTLAYSTPQDQGFNSSALSISDAIGASVTIAAMGLTFVALQGSGVEYPVVFLIAAGLALLALVPGVRLDPAPRAHSPSARPSLQ